MKSPRGRRRRARPCSEGQEWGARATEDLALGPGWDGRSLTPAARFLLAEAGWRSPALTPVFTAQCSEGLPPVRPGEGEGSRLRVLRVPPTKSLDGAKGQASCPRLTA